MKNFILSLFLVFALCQSAYASGNITALVDSLEVADSMVDTLEQAVMVSNFNGRIVNKKDRITVFADDSFAAEDGTAAGILQSIPSVNVDPEGGLKFRGSSNFLVYVDGKPSALDGLAALQQIPASSVESIDIITTPSARYKTDGDVGIINVTTKSLSSQGWSGIVNLAGSTLGTYSLDGVLNYQSGKSNYYVGGTLQDIRGKSDFYQKKVTDVSGIETTSISDGQRFSSNATRTGRAGWRFNDGARHDLSIDVVAGVLDNWRGGNMTYSDVRSNSEGGEYDSKDRYNLMKKIFQESVSYVFKIDENRELSATSRLRYDRYAIEYTESNMFFKNTDDRYEGTRGYEEEHHWDADGSLSYKRKTGRYGLLEAGYQYVTYSEHGGYKIKYWNLDAAQFEWQDDITTPFYYRRQVHSLYAMYSDRAGIFNFDAGLRDDWVHDQMDIEVKDASRDLKYSDLFPSAHVSCDLGAAGSLRLGYSYRTNRPGIWNLEPYITYEDYYTKKMGDPDIRPEYAHSAELGWRKSFSGGLSLGATLYCRYRKDIFEWVRSAYEPGVTLDRIMNAGNQLETGGDVSASWKVCDWFQTSLSGGTFNYDFESKNPVCTSADGMFAFGRWENDFSLGKNSKLRFDANYTGRTILTQGSENAYFYCNLAYRKQFTKQNITLSAVAHDIFRTARYVKTREAAGLYSLTDIKPLYPNILVSLSYNFRQSTHKAATISETSLFEGKDF